MSQASHSNGHLPQLPAPLLVEARFESHALADAAGETLARLDAALSAAPLEGKRVAVAVGSRGIDQIATVARAAVEYLKRRGAEVFIVPAMGSHGGATAEGQAEVLGALGVTEASAGAPVRAETETALLGETAGGVPVHVARTILEADALLLINRVKPHTDFESDRFGSGIRKMSVIGVGNAASSFAAHRAAKRRGYEAVIEEVSDFVLSKLPLVFGLALVEDAYHKLSHVEALSAAAIPAREEELLTLAKRRMPALPFAEIDVLVLDEIGKNVSGAGMDPNITGRDIRGVPRRNRRATVGAIYARSLTPESHGNAIGLGFAEVVSARLVAEMDRDKTFKNALSAMTPAAVRTPMHFDSDAECIAAALRLADADAPTGRVVRVRNTLALDRFVATANYAAEIRERDDLRVIEELREWPFTPAGDFDPAREVLGRA
jgi:hypothetical protein